MAQTRKKAQPRKATTKSDSASKEVKELQDTAEDTLSSLEEAVEELEATVSSRATKAVDSAFNKKKGTATKPKGKQIMIVHLRVYKHMSNQAGKPMLQILKDDNGNISNENQLVKLRHDTLEWHNYLKQLSNSGWFKADVEKVFAGARGTFSEIETPQTIVDEIKAAMQPEEPTLTPEQQRIKDLEEQVQKLLEKN